MSRALEIAIINTLQYHNLFDYPLTFDEIKKYQILKIKNKKHKLNIKNELDKLINDKYITKAKGYYCLPNRGKIIDLRKEREVYSKEKIKIAKGIIRLIKVIPWVKMIGITGALAMGNSGQDDDIDLLIITQGNRLWLTRIILVILLELLGKRRRPNNSKYKNKICLNMFLDESVLRQAQDKQNLYTAHEIVQMKPIWNKDKTYEKFIKANKWVRRYLPNSIKCQMSNVKSKKPYYSASWWMLITYCMDRLEQLAFQLQYKYMKSKMTREQVNEHFAFFHPQDRTREILSKFRKV